MPYYFAETKTTEMASIVCSKCRKEIQEIQGCFQCDSCKKYFHPSCKGILGKHIQRLAANRTWSCTQDCESKIKSTTDASQQSVSSLGNPNHSNIEICSKLDGLVHIYNEQANSVSNMCLTMENLNKTVSEIRASQEFLSTQFDKALNDLKILQNENNSMQKTIKGLTDTQQLQQNTISHLEAEIDKIHQEKLANNIIITGLSNQLTKPDVIFQKICSNLNIAMKQGCDIVDINFMHANHPASNLNKDTKEHKFSHNFIVVKFANEHAKKVMMDGMRTKGTLFTNEIGLDHGNNRRIYIRHQLTSFKAKLYRDSLVVKNKYAFKYMWIKNYTIYLRKDDGTKAYAVNSSRDILTIQKQLAGSVAPEVNRDVDHI